MAPSNDPLLLASRSPRRRQLLGVLRVPFRLLITPEVEASLTLPEGTPEQQAEALALAKAEATMVGFREGLVLAADTIVVLDGAVLGKPRDANEARAMLRRLRGRKHRVVTGIALVEVASGRRVVAHEETSVTMRAYTDEDIERYAASGEPLDKAGAYAIQDPTFVPAAAYQGCYQNVVGLPLCTLKGALAPFGRAIPPLPLADLPYHCQLCQLVGTLTGDS